MQKFIFQNLKFTWPNLYTDWSNTDALRNADKEIKFI